MKKVKSDYFTVLEYDDIFSPIWFKMLKKYMGADVNDTFAFLPLTEVVDYETKLPFGYSNEAVWASSFTEELGYYDIQSLEYNLKPDKYTNLLLEKLNISFDKEKFNKYINE